MNTVELIYKELRELITSNVESLNYRWRCEFIIDDKVIPLTRISKFDRVNDYDEKVMEGLNVIAEVPLGTYNHVIYPDRKKIKALLYKIPLSAKDGEVNVNLRTYSKLYDCVLLSNSSATVTDGSEVVTNKELADRDHSTTVEFQLIDPIANNYRMHEFSCILRKVTVMEAMELLITGRVYGPDEPLPPVMTPEAYAAKTFNESAEKSFSRVEGRQIVPPDNMRRYKHIIIPTGTRLVDLPDFLQVNYGVYNNGLGSYYHEGIMYVYPITDVNRYKTTKRFLTIAKFPEELGTQARTTWVLKDTMELYVAATSQVNHNDFSDWVELNKGIIHYNLNSEVVIDEAIEVNEDKITAVPGDNLLFTSQYARQAGDSHVSLSSRKIAGNMFFENSRINFGKTGVMSIVWENSEPELLYPGMPVRYLFPVGDIIAELKGTLVMADSETAAARESLIETTYVTTTVLGVRVESIGNL